MYEDKEEDPTATWGQAKGDKETVFFLASAELGGMGSES